MIRYLIFFSALVFVFIQPMFGQENSSNYDLYWPQWRGPEANGLAPKGNPPIEWNETKNIKWKIEIPGKGHSTPIIWEDKIFILTAIETSQKIEKEEAEEEQGGRRMSGLTAESVLMNTDTKGRQVVQNRLCNRQVLK